MLYEKDIISTAQIYEPGIYREKDTEGRKHEKASGFNLVRDRQHCKCKPKGLLMMMVMWPIWKHVPMSVDGWWALLVMNIGCGKNEGN